MDKAASNGRSFELPGRLSARRKRRPAEKAMRQNKASTQSKGKVMRRSKSEIYLHFVWTTVQRLPLITPDIEEALHQAIIAEATRCGAEVLAVGGVENHIHLLIKKPPTISESHLMQRVKGFTSAQVRQQIAAPEDAFSVAGKLRGFQFSRRPISDGCRVCTQSKTASCRKPPANPLGRSRRGGPEPCE